MFKLEHSPVVQNIMMSVRRQFNPLLCWWGAKYFSLKPSCLPKKPENVTLSDVGPQLWPSGRHCHGKWSLEKLSETLVPSRTTPVPVIYICHHNYPSILVTCLATVTRQTLHHLLSRWHLCPQNCGGQWSQCEPGESQASGHEDKIHGEWDKAAGWEHRSLISQRLLFSVFFSYGQGLWGLSQGARDHCQELPQLCPVLFKQWGQRGASRDDWHEATGGHHRGRGGRGRGHRPPAPHHRRQGAQREQPQLKQVLWQDILKGESYTLWKLKDKLEM